MLRRLSFGLLLLASAGAFSQFLGSAPPPAHLAQGFHAIRTEDVKTWISYLAGPECAGRGTGQDGYQKAAEYVAARFKEFGLKPVGAEGTYFQNVPFVRTEVDVAQSHLEVAGVRLPFGGELTMDGVVSDFEAEGGVVFVRGSVTDSETLRGRVVLFDGEMSRETRIALQRAQPAAVFTLSDSVGAAEPRISAAGRGPRQGRPSGRISRAAAERLASAAGVSLPTEEMGATMLVTPATAKVVAKVKSTEVGVPNVVGLLEGSDPVLKEEVVGIGAHLDHLGTRGDVVYYGADDDASGSTALIAVAKALSSNPTLPKRSILFIAFCGEEMGLIGSRYYTDNPLIPNEKMICHLQMDMVGRNEESETEPASENGDTIHLVGSKRLSSELHALVLAMNRHVNFRFEYDEEDVFSRSDHVNFHNKGIPVAFLFDGFHPDYHQPSDTVDKINLEKIANAARLFYLVAFEAANRDAPFKKDSGGAASKEKAA
ncbi:MAG: M20/M25/M40 family metallo-hydrolase [Armatimonadota bacterium]